MSTNPAAATDLWNALANLREWCHNNVAYFPPDAEAQAIDAAAEAALEKGKS